MKKKLWDSVDKIPFWWLGFALFAITFLPFLILGEGSVFTINDQLDESMMNYVLTARNLGKDSGIFYEMLGGVQPSGLQPSAILFVPLYRFLPPFTAFVIQYGVCFLSAFFGMYFCVRELTKSNVIAFAMAGAFCMLPLYPIYGLSEYGIPLLLYACLCLWKKKNDPVAYVLIAFFGLTSHLVYTGYGALFFVALALLVLFIRKEWNKGLFFGFLELLGVYLIENHALFKELFWKDVGYASHREEMVTYAMPFLKTVGQVFVNSAQHADSLHKYLILPIIVLLAAGAFLKKEKEDRQRYFMAVTGIVILAGIALFYGICRSEWAVAYKNSMRGFLHYFQIERFYWFYPAGWYLEFALALSVWWNRSHRQLLKITVLVLLLLPTLNLIKGNSLFYRNVNQMNNGSGITGYITWESYYSEELMQKLEDFIGKDMSTYRVAHLGISPAPALMHGFYTVDGYSNNYPLEYKHRFRKVIASELEKNEEMRLYFDEWGNRCYLFNSITGNYFMLGKNTGVTYQDLEFDMDALKELGCEYLFSGGEILDAKRMGLESMGYFETDSSYWGIWLYKIN